MNIVIKKLSDENIDECITIQANDGYPHQYYLTSKRIERLIRRGEKFFTAWSANCIVGFCSVDCEIRAYVHFICVDKSFTRCGIGTLLMHTCLDIAKRFGCKQAYTYVEANSSKELFLKKMKFNQVGLYKDRYGNGVDASIWEIRL